jgi:hypothetical protein
MVAVTGSPFQPVIVDRRRIELAEASERGPVQPFHTAQDLGAKHAQAFLDQCRTAWNALACTTLETVVKNIGGDRVRHCAVLMGSGRAAPTLEATLASHAAIHTAEGEFFREIVLHAAESCGLRALRIKEKELFHLAEVQFETPAASLLETLNGLGKIVGPPWQQDQKFASLAAWLAAVE